MSVPSTLTIGALLPRDLSIDTSQMKLKGNGATTHAGAAGFMQEKIRDSVDAALHIDVLELIADAWSRTADIQTAAAAAAKPGASPAPTHLYLAKHEIVCDNQLKVALEFAGLDAITDHLDLRLKAMFDGVGLLIENGCIVAVDLGRAAARAELRYSNATLLGQSTDWVALPSKSTLKRPLQIGSGRVA